MSSGWFDCAKPCLPSSLQGKQGVQGVQGVQGAYALGQRGSSTSNLLDPSQSTVPHTVAYFRASAFFSSVRLIHIDIH